MPVPKEQQKRYGIIVATLQARGDSLEVAKRKADEAIKKLESKKRRKS